MVTSSNVPLPAILEIGNFVTCYQRYHEAIITCPFPPQCPPLQPKVHKYKPDEINLADLTSHAETILGVKPYVFQLEIAAAVLRGEDVILDVGTGSGKSLCFALPFLLHDTDITMVVSPLNALMIDQVSLLAVSQVKKHKTNEIG